MLQVGIPSFLFVKRVFYLLDSYCCTVSIHLWLPMQDAFGGSVCHLKEMSHSHIVFQHDKSGLNHNETLRECPSNAFLGFARDGTVEDMPQIKYSNIDVDACPVENAIAASIIKSPRVPSASFEFYVMSEEGINLYVDLNSSPSEWTKRFKNEVYICEGVHRNKSGSLHQDLGHFGEPNKQTENSFIGNVDSVQINDGHVLKRSSPSSKMIEDDHMVFERPDKGDASLLSSAIMSCGMALDESENMKKDQVLILSEPSSNTQDQINSAAESCAKDQCTVILDSDVTDTLQLKSASNSVVNSESNCPLSPLASKDQNSKGDEIFENSTMQNSCSLVNPSVVYPGCSASGSLEMPTSDVASKDASTSAFETDGLLDLVDPKRNTELGGLANSSELNHDLLPTCVEEWVCSVPLPPHLSDTTTPPPKKKKKQQKGTITKSIPHFKICLFCTSVFIFIHNFIAKKTCLFPEDQEMCKCIIWWCFTCTASCTTSMRV